MKIVNITYRQVGDYKIPNLTLPVGEKEIKLGKWGRAHGLYLQKNKQVIFTQLFSAGKLWSHLAEIDKQAEDLFNTLVTQIAKAENVTEKLKETNQLEWVQRMNNIHQRVTEIVNRELIYS